ncbi:MAG TPA: amidohydrolase family protein, partial [Longimicrobiales bacterium]|nr:amidohydrolase family protein [Longimicrobiales bacterium]
NLRLTVKAGLSEDDAIRALTLTPAELFGVADRVGSLDVGKTANLTVTEGDLFEDGSRVRMVFVDGRRFPVEERVASADSADGPGGPSARGGGGGGRGGRGAAQTTEWTGVTPMTPTGPYQEADVWLITGATIMTGTGETIENGQILVRDGKIAAIGQDVDAPAGAEVIDAEGKYVIPGIIDAHSHIAADAINEGTVNVSAMVGIQDVLDPDDVSIYRAAAGGVTTANILHGSANPIGGKNAVIKMRWGAEAHDLLLDGAPPGIKFALGENVKRDRNPDRYPNTRMGVQDVIRRAFIDAREYMDRWDRYEAARQRGERVFPPRRDQKLETLAEVPRGERLVHAHSYRADEILQLMRTAEDFGVRIATFQHVLEGYKVADELAAHGAGASTFSDWWAYKVEAYDAIPYNAALMTERGVTVSINSDSGEEMRHLNQEAAKTMRWGGMDEHQALAMVTLNPARQLGIDDRVGSLEVGKDADLVIYNGHPLSVFSSVDKTMIDGKIYFDREGDRERQARLEAEKQTLLEKLRGARRSRPVTEDGALLPLDAQVPGGVR